MREPRRSKPPGGRRPSVPGLPAATPIRRRLGKCTITYSNKILPVRRLVLTSTQTRGEGRESGVTVPHEPWLVVLSIAIAIQGSFVGLSLAAGLDTATGFRRRLALAGSALTLATGVWSMHFVGMLAARFPSAIDYLALPTLTSFLICVIVVGMGVYAAHASGLTGLRIGLGALAMGLGVSTMHYVGMSAVHLAGPVHYEPLFVVASVVVSVAASAFALLALGKRPNRMRLFLGAVVLGLAISGMHYTAMAGMRLDPLCFDSSRFVDVEPALSRNTLALLATVISFGVSGAFLLSLVPDVQMAAPRLAAGPAPLAEAAGVAIPIPVADIAAGAGPAVEKAGAPFASLRVEKDGRPLSSPWRTSAPFAPTRVTRSSTTASGNISATSRSARSKPLSIPPSSCASIAATSSGSRASRGSAGRARPPSPCSPRRRLAAFRSPAGSTAGSSCESTLCRARPARQLV